MRGKLLSETAGTIRLCVHAQPGAKRNAVVGLHGDALKVAVTSPPADGKANEAIRVLLAESFSLPLLAVAMASGQASRRKTYTLSGLSLTDAQERLNQLLSGKR